MSANRKNKSRLLHYSTEEKIALIKAVKSCELIWDIKNRFHNDPAQVKSEWEKVSAMVNKDSSDCRFAWRALRDSYRYHKKVAERKLIKCGITEPSLEKIYASVEWQFAPYMRFYPELNYAKTKCSSNNAYEDNSSTSQSASENSSPGLYAHEDDNSTFMVLDDSSNCFDDEPENNRRKVDETLEIVCINEDEDEDNSDNFILPETNFNCKSNYNEEKTLKEPQSTNNIGSGPNRNNGIKRDAKNPNHSQEISNKDVFDKMPEDSRSKRRKRADKPKASQKLVTIVEQFLQKQLEPPSTEPQLSPANLPALQYWDSLLNSMTPAAARKAERAVTELLLAQCRSSEH